MRLTVLAVAVTAATLVAPAQSFAWGFTAHQLIMKRAIDLLPGELKPFYEHYRAEIETRVVDPDLWRNVGWDDDPNHFLDLGVAEYGKPPYAELPRDYGAALQKFGAATLKKYGTLPWREEEMFGSLRRGLEGMAQKRSYSISDVTLFSAVAAHYMQDATQPFHATDNYYGQMTGNHGIHARFERDLVEKFGSSLHLNPVRPTPIDNARDTAFDALMTSHALLERILSADKAAVASKQIYDDEYFEKFFAAVQPILEQ